MSKEIAAYKNINHLEGITVPIGLNLNVCPSKAQIEGVLDSGYKLELSDIYADNELVALRDINIVFQWPTILTNLQGKYGATAILGGICHSTSTFTGTDTEQWQTFYNNAIKDNIKFQSADNFVLSVGDAKRWYGEETGNLYYFVARAGERYMLYTLAISYSAASRLNDPEGMGYDHQEQIQSTFVRDLTYIVA